MSNFQTAKPVIGRSNDGCARCKRLKREEIGKAPGYLGFCKRCMNELTITIDRKILWDFWY